MNIIEQFPNGISVVDHKGAYCVRDTHGKVEFLMRCGSLDEAIRRARIESWRYLCYDFQAQCHDHFLEWSVQFCNVCPLRETSGCIGSICPVHHMMDEINKSMLKLTEKAARAKRAEIEKSKTP